HANIVSLIGASWDAPEPLIISKYMPYGNVMEYIDYCKSNGQRIDKLKILHAIAAGMHYLHEYRNIVHADLKPENALVDADGTTCLTDFGFSKTLGRDAQGISDHG
ncbi:kinase-like protein, partial [Gonapodya prolifera JEL478]